MCEKNFEKFEAGVSYNCFQKVILKGGSVNVLSSDRDFFFSEMDVEPQTEELVYALYLSGDILGYGVMLDKKNLKTPGE